MVEIPAKTEAMMQYFLAGVRSGTYKLVPEYTPCAWVKEGRVDKEVWDSVNAPRSVARFVTPLDLYNEIVTRVRYIGDAETQYSAMYTLMEIAGHDSIHQLKPP